MKKADTPEQLKHKEIIKQILELKISGSNTDANKLKIQKLQQKLENFNSKGRI